MAIMLAVYASTNRVSLRNMLKYSSRWRASLYVYLGWSYNLRISHDISLFLVYYDKYYLPNVCVWFVFEITIGMEVNEESRLDEKYIYEIN